MGEFGVKSQHHPRFHHCWDKTPPLGKTQWVCTLPVCGQRANSAPAWPGTSWLWLTWTLVLLAGKNQPQPGLNDPIPSPRTPRDVPAGSTEQTQSWTFRNILEALDIIQTLWGSYGEKSPTLNVQLSENEIKSRIYLILWWCHHAHPRVPAAWILRAVLEPIQTPTEADNKLLGHHSWSPLFSSSNLQLLMCKNNP